jgi:hypothetical protein
MRTTARLFGRLAVPFGLVRFGLVPRGERYRSANVKECRVRAVSVLALHFNGDAKSRPRSSLLTDSYSFLVAPRALWVAIRTEVHASGWT